MIKHVLFDLDGTVIDSKECIFLVYRKLFEKHGLTLPDGESMRRFIGPPVETTLANYVPVEEAKALAEDFREIYKTVDLVATNTLYPGIADAVRKIKAQGRQAYIATSKSERFAVGILQGLGAYDLFDGVYGSRYDLGENNRLQKEDVLRFLLRENGIRNDECILIGDTLFDVEGAEKCDLPVAIVRYGFGSPDDFVGKKIAFFADLPADLPEKLEEYDG